MKQRAYFTYAAPPWLTVLFKAATAVVGFSAAIILLCWIFEAEALIRIRPGMVAMNPLTAICFVFLAVGLWHVGKGGGNPTPGQRRLAVGLGIVVALVGGLKVADFSLGLGFHIDRILFASRLEPAIGFPPNEMAPNTALNLLFCGVSLVIFDFETPRGFRPAQAFVLLAGLIGLLAVIGYSYRVLLLYRVRGAIPMALGTAIDFLVFCLGSLAARPRSGFMTILTSPTTGGAMARRLLPTAILVPWVIGAVLLAWEQKGYFHTDSAISIYAVASILIFSALTWWNANLLYRADSVRADTERRLAVQHGATRVLADSARLSQAAPAILQKICETLGWQTGAMWTVEEGDKIKCTEFWRNASFPELADFEAESRKAVLAPGEGLPGSVWAAQQPVWIRDVAKDPQFRRASAAKAGLRGAFAFPIMLGTQFFGVMEFFSRRVEKEDRMLMEIALAIGSQIGQFIERTLAEEHLREASVNLERSNTELQQFAYTASHDLNEPLRMITSYLQLLNERSQAKLDAPGREFIAFALEGAERMRALIADLLAYSRLEVRARGFERTDAEKAFQAALQNLKVAIEENHAQVEHDPLPAVRADAVQLTQVFQNLLGNAIKFHGGDSPHIQVTVRQQGREWVFAVHDNGIGIEPKDFERIFVISQRLHTRREYSGTGMGLAICKKIIERHGGRLWVESAPQKGSTFFFTLPVLREERNP